MKRATGSPYLPPDEARGCVYCFDPESALLRAALTAPPPTLTTRLARDLLAEDVRFLHVLMKKQYAGYPDLLQQSGFDVDTFFSDWLAKIDESAGRSGVAISFGNGVVEPLAQLRRIVPDRHFFVGSDAALRADLALTFHEFQVLRPADLRLEQCEVRVVPGALPSSLRAAPMLRVDGSRTTMMTLSATGLSTAVDLAYGETSIHLVRRAAALPPMIRQPQLPAYEWRATGDVTIITLRAFGGSGVVREQLRRFAADYAEHVCRPKILFDLRGNGGGSLEYVDQWITQACRGPWYTYPRLEIVGALWPCSLWNVLVERQIRDGSVDTAEARRERDNVRASWPAHRPAHTSILDAGFREGYAAEPYAGQVFVLVDRHSGSSGELAAVQLKRALGAVVVGERTAGTMHYGEVRRFVLPHTGLICQLPTKRFFFDEPVESVGWPVDVYLEDVTVDAAAIVPLLESLSAFG